MSKHTILKSSLTASADTLDEEQIAAWVSRQIEEGHFALEDLPRRMARWALSHPAMMQMRLQSAWRNLSPTKTSLAGLLIVNPGFFDVVEELFRISSASRHGSATYIGPLASRVRA